MSMRNCKMAGGRKGYGEMSEFSLTRVELGTGVGLDVAVAGDAGNDAIILLHGFPESHRTWRFQINELAKTHFVIAPDQRGYGGSDKPEGASHYAPDRIIADVMALADHFDIARFTLVGHDWGGAIAWGAALTRPDRVARLVILNAPHPLIFQRSLFDDLGQRAASQYMRAFRSPEANVRVAQVGLAGYLAEVIGNLSGNPALRPEDIAHYLEYWARPGAAMAMLNWYRGSSIVVPGMPGSDDDAPARPAYLDKPFPRLTMPVLVIWGMDDVALKPVQIEGLDAVAEDLTLVPVDAGHFVPWEAPEAVNAAMAGWLQTHPLPRSG